MADQLDVTQHHRPLPKGRFPDPPDLGEKPLNLFSLPYVQLIEALSDVLYPPNTVTDRLGGQHLVRASDARVDRYVLFRSAWDPGFGARVQLALRDLAAAADARHSDHFANLDEASQARLLIDLEAGKLTQAEWLSPREQKDQFALLFQTVTDGFFGEPGYGGNHEGRGWYYANFVQMSGR
jgi:hypothetical protein